MSDSASATVVLIHGVGGFLDEASRRDSERVIASQLETGRDVDFIWFDWNKAIADPRSDSIDLQNVAHGTRTSARLEFPDRIDDLNGRRGGNLARLKAAFWRLESLVAGIQVPLMALLLVHCVWLAAGWAARVLHQEPPPLELKVRLTHVLLPALDPILLERSFPTALATLPLTAMAALVAVPALQIALAGISGGVPLRVALRGAALDLTRPLLALLTMPGLVIPVLLMVSGGLALFFALLSRPVQVVDLEGAALTYGGDGAGIFALPLALFAAAVVISVTSFVLGGLLKVVSDIVRYLGHPAYRARIHDHLLERLAELDARQIVIVAHSLGSVIAVDSLLAHPEAWSRFPRLRLVTCGSPLRRLFHRFFPATYPVPDALLRLLQQTYGDVAWTNVFRPLDYVGGRLGRLARGAILDTRLPQRHHLHIAYWTDRQLTGLINVLVGDGDTGPTPSAPFVRTAPLPLERFRYGNLGGERWFSYVRWAVFVAGCVILIAAQIAWVPQAERDHLLDWHRRLNTEGADLNGELCPQREIDSSEEVSFFERAVAGVRFKTRGGQVWTLEAYSDSRPDIAWDEVQKAVFGRVPHSPLVAGLRAGIFLKDPLLDIKTCRPVDMRYAASDPRIFRLPDRFHVTPTVGILTRLTRNVLLLFLWSVWWFVVSSLIAKVLGLSAATRLPDGRLS